MNIRGKRALSLEEVYFRPVQGGYLYDAPNPWLAGRGARYIVNEAQRAALLDIVKPQRNGLRIFAVTWLWAATSHGHMGNLAMVGVMVTTLVPFYLVGVAYRFRYLARIAPVVSTAIETDQTFSTSERTRAIYDRLPLWMLIFFAVIWPLQAIISVMWMLDRASSPGLASDGHFYIHALSALAASAMTGMMIYALINRRRREA
jgi:hypothetical protein